MKTFCIITIIIINVFSGFGQSFIKFGINQYDLKYNNYDYYTSKHTTKTYHVSKFIQEFTTGIIDPSPPYNTINFTEFTTDSLIGLNWLVDSIGTSVDSLKQYDIKLVLEGKYQQIKGYDVWVCDDSTVFLKVRGDEPVNKLDNLIYFLKHSLKNYKALIFSKIYYQKKETGDVNYGNFELECNFK